jgi:alpha-L-fucosidase
MNDNWGYNAQDHHFKSVPQLIGLLVETASKGGNLLLNIGPRADGTFPDESVERLAAIGKWMDVNGGAIHGSTASPFAHTPFRVTSQPNRLNLFITEWTEQVTLPGLKTPIARAYLLADAAKSSLAVVLNERGAQVVLPTQAPDAVSSVVVCEFSQPPQVAG